MRDKADAHGLDLLVIDTGDRVEGNGLYDSSEPKGVYISDILRHQHIDLLTSGNHELYKKNTSDAEFYTTVRNFRGNYLASNIDIIHPKTGEVVPLAPRFKKFATKNQNIRIVAFGFIFDFTGNSNTTIVQPVEETVKEDWFQEAIRDKDVDLFLVTGHVPVKSKEYTAIFKAIRAVRWDLPIQFFGGHYHIRDYAQYDSRSYGLASGRFMETIGFMSIDGLSTGGQPERSLSRPTFNRRYIDNNLYSFYHHTGLYNETFHTDEGRNTSDLIYRSRSALQLDKVHGCAPKDYWMLRTRYPSKDNVYTWLAEQVLPGALRDDSRSGKPALAVVNTGAIRFDVFKGPFTQDSTFIVSPFTSGFRYVKDVSYGQATLIVEILNKQPQILAKSQHQATFDLAPPEQVGYSQRMLDSETTTPLTSQEDSDHLSGQIPLNSATKKKVVPGYTTEDDAGTDGDDTIHSPITFYRVPNCIQSLVSSNSSHIPEKVDLVYIDFIEPYVAHAAKYAGLDVDFEKDTDVYMPSTSFTNLILDWVKANWKCESGSGDVQEYGSITDGRLYDTL